MKTALEQRNELFTAYLGEFADKGFKLHETEDGLELWRGSQRCERFSWHGTIQAIRDCCQSWLIKEDGISYEAAK